MVVIGFIVPGVAFGANIISHSSFGGIFIKTVSFFAMLTLISNGVAILAYKDRD